MTAPETSTAMVLRSSEEAEWVDVETRPSRGLDVAHAHQLRALARAARAFADTLDDELDASPPVAFSAAIVPSPSPAPLPSRSDYMTAAEYAAHRRVSRTTVFGWIRRGLPSSKQGGTRRISWREADSFLDSGALSKAQHKPVRLVKRTERTAA